MAIDRPYLSSDAAIVDVEHALAIVIELADPGDGCSRFHDGEGGVWITFDAPPRPPIRWLIRELYTHDAWDYEVSCDRVASCDVCEQHGHASAVGALLSVFLRRTAGGWELSDLGLGALHARLHARATQPRRLRRRRRRRPAEGRRVAVPPADRSARAGGAAMITPRPNACGPRAKLRPREATCLALLAAGQRPGAVAAAMVVDKTQVSRWARKFRALNLLPQRPAS